MRKCTFYMQKSHALGMLRPHTGPRMLQVHKSKFTITYSVHSNTRRGVKLISNSFGSRRDISIQQARLSLSHISCVGRMWELCVGRRMEKSRGTDGEVDVWSLVAELVWSVELGRWFEGTGSLNSVMSQRGRWFPPHTQNPSTLPFISFHVAMI